MANTQNISIRIAVLDGDKTRRELTLTGEAGQKALKRIEEATRPASRQLAAVNVVGEQVRYGMENLAASSGNLGSSLIRLGPVGLAAAAALGALTVAVAGGIREFKEAEQALNQLNAALKATDFTAGVTASEITALGEAIEGNTLFKKEDIQQAASALTSFQNVSGEVFSRAIRLSADLAVRLGTDVPSAADMLGKALELPAEGLGRLARKFSDLSASQKEAIDNFVKVGDVASAQAIILEHLESKTRVLAEAQAQGLTGATNELSDAWDDLLEAFGRTVNESGAAESALHGLTKAVRYFQEAVNPTRQQRKSQLEEELASIENGIPAKLDRYVFGFSPAVDEKKKELQKINDEIAAEQQKLDDEKNKAREASELAASKRRNDKLLELEKTYLKESEALTLTAQQKILKESEERKKQILALDKGENSDVAKEALFALDKSTKAKLVDADKTDRNTVKPQEDARKKAIEDINREILRTKPSFEQAKLALDDWKANLIENLGGATEENQKYIDQIEQIYTVRLKEIYNKSQTDSESWADGASRALKRYADDATDASKNAEMVFSNASKTIEDTLVDMATTGEFSMKKLGDALKSIAQDVLRATIRQQITGPLAGGLSSGLGSLFSSGAGAAAGSAGGAGGMASLFASFFHDGGEVGITHTRASVFPASMFANAPRFHKGLMPDEFPAILQKGETVLPRNSKMGGVNMVFNISTPNAQSFKDSQGQIMAKYASTLQRYKNRNN